jgi:hypothetical protein
MASTSGRSVIDWRQHEEAPRRLNSKRVHPVHRGSLRGANESVRWLRACAARNFGARQQCVALLDEGRRLAKILGRIVVTSKRRDEEG